MNFFWTSTLFEETHNYLNELLGLYDFKSTPLIYKEGFKKKAIDTSKNVVKKKILESEYDYYIS